MASTSFVAQLREALEKEGAAWLQPQIAGKVVEHDAAASSNDSSGVEIQATGALPPRGRPEGPPEHGTHHPTTGGRYNTQDTSTGHPSLHPIRGGEEQVTEVETPTAPAAPMAEGTAEKTGEKGADLVRLANSAKSEVYVCFEGPLGARLKSEVKEKIWKSYEAGMVWILGHSYVFWGSKRDEEQIRWIGVPGTHLDSMNSPFTTGEIESIITTLPNGKSPGPDGFSNEYFKTFPKLLSPCLQKFFTQAAEQASFPQEMLKAYVTTIPKPGKDPTTPSNYRPISLLNSDIKIYAKLLAKRLEEFIPSLINNDQMGFIRGRQTSDATRRITNVVHHAALSKTPSLLLYIDAEKAFDRVDWSYMREVLCKFGFHGTIFNAMMALYSCPSAQVLTADNINQNPEILPNITLGFHVTDSCIYSSMAVRNVLSILSGPQKTVPNYSCSGKDKLVGFIGDHFSVTTIPMAQILGIYGYTQLYNYVKEIKYSFDSKEPVPFFNEYGEFAYKYKITNWIHKDGMNMIYKDVGNFTPWAPEDQQFQIDIEAITWKFSNGVPVSRCSAPCLPGSRKKFGSSIHKCCYECVACPEGEISNSSDSENCMKCPDDEWPNEKKDRCFPKSVEFLSYTDDTISAVFSSLSILCCLLTGLILGIFVHYQDTPIVKANNRNLSYLLLVSIMLSFLCVFLFLGRPVDVTCMLRVTSFGVIFSVAVSSLLAKSIMVCIAFKTTKPGSFWKKWMGARFPISIMCVCSLVQLIICVSWLSISPPFQDRDTHSYQGKIIIQCNEGSVIGFYSVLGYMGLLAAVSFIIAFLAKTLPDSFNEAKYITFSMLVFCSVWIAMIPAYLSTKGKDMVAVEVFAIMASSSGLLGCMFFPKCYKILFRPDLNTKIDFLRNKGQ
ncbi:uncharacterized protein LOC143975928 [Lithobates pipiens]